MKNRYKYNTRKSAAVFSFVFSFCFSIVRRHFAWLCVACTRPFVVYITNIQTLRAAVLPILQCSRTYVWMDVYSIASNNEKKGEAIRIHEYEPMTIKITITEHFLWFWTIELFDELKLNNFHAETKNGIIYTIDINKFGCLKLWQMICFSFSVFLVLFRQTQNQALFWLLRIIARAFEYTTAVLRLYVYTVVCMYHRCAVSMYWYV